MLYVLNRTFSTGLSPTLRNGDNFSSWRKKATRIGLDLEKWARKEKLPEALGFQIIEYKYMYVEIQIQIQITGKDLRLPKAYCPTLFANHCSGVRSLPEKYPLWGDRER